MQKHTKTYLKEMGYQTCDSIPCEVCDEKMKPGIGDIHHIDGRRGKDPDRFENLICLCRICHKQAHGIKGKISKDTLRGIAARRLV